MTTLTIRNGDAAVRDRLRIRAARNGRSMGAELRQIVAEAVGAETNRETNLAEAVRRRFAPLGGIDDLELHPRVTLRDPPTFD